jgi:hypothetical protein
MMRGSTELFEAVYNSGLIEVVGGHLNLNAVTHRETDEAFSHFTGDVGQDNVFIVEFDAEQGARQHRVDAALEFDRFFSDRLLHAGEIGVPLYGSEFCPGWGAKSILI